VCRFGRRVSRAFSLSKTPRSMKRAISSVTHIMSPMRRESSVCGLPSVAQTTPHGVVRPSSNLSVLDGSDIDITVWIMTFWLDCVNFKTWFGLLQNTGAVLARYCFDATYMDDDGNHIQWQTSPLHQNHLATVAY